MYLKKTIRRWISELPSSALVTDYFRWRNEDAHRNALNAYCYWELRKDGESAARAAASLEKKSVAEKNEFLFQSGINFNAVPGWQKRGVGLHWEKYEKPGFDRKQRLSTTCTRRRLKIDYELPMGDEYGLWLQSLLRRCLA